MFSLESFNRNYFFSFFLVTAFGKIVSLLTEARKRLGNDFLEIRENAKPKLPTFFFHTVTRGLYVPV